MYSKSDFHVDPGFTYRLTASPLCLTWEFSITAKSVPRYFIFPFKTGKT